MLLKKSLAKKPSHNLHVASYGIAMGKLLLKLQVTAHAAGVILRYGFTMDREQLAIP